jgi:hypothetical protein
MARVGWILVALGCVVVAASAAPLLYVVAATGDPTINPVIQGMLFPGGGFVGLLIVAVGACLVFKARRGKWPAGF